MRFHFSACSVIMVLQGKWPKWRKSGRWSMGLLQRYALALNFHRISRSKTLKFCFISSVDIICPSLCDMQYPLTFDSWRSLEFRATSIALWPEDWQVTYLVGVTADWLWNTWSMHAFLCGPLPPWRDVTCRVRHWAQTTTHSLHTSHYRSTF